MLRLTQVFLYAMLSSLSVAAVAQKPSNTFEGYAVFSEMHANAPVPLSGGDDLKID